MNWSSLTPRERDALVAEKVMGWVIDPGACHDDPTEIHTAFLFDPAQYPDAYPSVSHGLRPERSDQFVPHYTTQIARAWEVVEKMQSMNHQQDIHIQCLHGKWDVSMCHFERNEEQMEWGDWTINAPTAPEAICKAALRAVGVKIED